MMVEPPPGARPGDGGRPKPWLPPTGDQCPVDAATQQWTESLVRWFLSQFGTEVINRDPTLPTADFLTTGTYAATEADIEGLVTDLSALMQVDRAQFDLELFDGATDIRTASDSAGAADRKRTVGHFRRVGGRMVISLDRQEAVTYIL